MSIFVGLIAVPAAVIAYLAIERRRERRAVTWANPALVPNLVDRPRPRTRHLAAALFLLALTFLLVAFARPEASLNSEREGATVVLTIDTSGSMATPDIKPTRLLAARTASLTFLNQLPSKYRVEVEIFTDHPAVIVPPTYDRTKIAPLLPTKAKIEGTDIGDAVETAVRVAVKTVGVNRPGAHRAPAAVLLISDGTQTVQGTTLTEAAKFARKAGVPVSTVLIGTPAGKLRQCVTAPGGFKQCGTQPSPTDPVDLKKIATVTDGRFFQVTSAAKWLATLQRIYGDFGSRQAHEHKKHEVTEIATGIALLFMLDGIGSRPPSSEASPDPAPARTPGRRRAELCREARRKAR
jgi:Ca-activated chloride channel family protein